MRRCIFHSPLIPVRFKGLEIADNIRTAAASGRLFLRKSSQNIAIRMFNDKFINDGARNDDERNVLA
uniref:Uncharacterized protein n=1 Tax=Vibrio phage Vc1 TaxID=1480731 RepID=A0A6M5CA06_9CAUD